MDNDWGAVYALTTEEHKKTSRGISLSWGRLDVRGFSIEKVDFAADKREAVVSDSFDTIRQGHAF